MRIEFEIRMLRPKPVLAEFPAVISPENYRGIISQTEAIEFINHPAYLSIDKPTKYEELKSAPLRAYQSFI